MSKVVDHSLAPGSADEAAQSSRRVAAEIVHDDDVAGPENWNELLFEIGFEAIAVDRPIEDSRGDDAVTAQSAEKGRHLPIPVRSKTSHPLALWSPTA